MSSSYVSVAPPAYSPLYVSVTYDTNVTTSAAPARDAFAPAVPQAEFAPMRTDRCLAAVARPHSSPHASSVAADTFVVGCRVSQPRGMDDAPTTAAVGDAAAAPRLPAPRSADAWRRFASFARTGSWG